MKGCHEPRLARGTIPPQPGPLKRNTKARWTEMTVTSDILTRFTADLVGGARATLLLPPEAPSLPERNLSKRARDRGGGAASRNYVARQACSEA